MGLKALIGTFLICLTATPLTAQQQDSIFVYELEGACVQTVSSTDGIRGDINRGIGLKLETLDNFPKVFGTSDPLKLVQTLPGVTTNRDNASGTIVQGCDIGHTATRLCDAPVFGHGHILGIFSMFIPEHFSEMDFSMSSDYGNLGGILSLDTSEKTSSKFTGNANAGPVVSYFSLSAPVCPNSSFRFSARRSLVDIFYKDLIKYDNFSLAYYFNDINAAYIHKLGSADIIDANLYTGRDNCEKVVVIKDTEIKTDWGDVVGNIRWRHTSERLSITTQAYYSRYSADGTFSSTDIPIDLSNSISDFGFSSKAGLDDRWEAGISFDSYRIAPQSSDTEKALAAAVYLGWKDSFDDFTVTFSANSHCFNNLSCNKTYFSLDPRFRLSYDFHWCGKLELNLARVSQELFFTGPTNSGFPVEFWIASGKYSDPQHSLSADLSYEVSILGGRVHLSADAYCKRLDNQLEYDSQLIDMFNSSFSLENALLKAEGINYGFYAMARKVSGPFTGWLSYSLGRSLRSIDSKSYFPSSHERIHELNAVASYKYRKWEFGANAIAASGQPFTPCTGAYLLNDTVLLEYGERNSARLTPYFRLDLSVSYNFRDSGRFRDGINLSVQNATGRKNAFMATLKINDGKYSFQPSVLLIPVLPSINYYCSF